MIKVSIKKSDSRRWLRLKVVGHAEQAEEGQDIVCASASILTYTVAQIVSDMATRGQLEGNPVISLNKGLATVTCVCKNYESYYEACSAYNVANIGYALLAHNYPQNVELETVIRE